MIMPIAFQLTHQPDFKSLAIKDRYGNSPLQKIAALQQEFFQSLLRDSFTLSLRYLYDPHAPQQLQIFLLFHTPEQLKLRLTSALQTSEFQQIYSFQEINNHQQLQTIQNLDWVEAIVEITKAETISDKGYYLPHPFAPNPDHSMVELCEQFARIGNFSPEKFLLEITLQPYPTQTAPWKNALDTLLSAHTKANSSPDATLETVIKGIRDYQTRYSHAPLFTYSLKLLAESDRHLSTLPTLWLQNATTSEYNHLPHSFLTIKRGDPAFQTSLDSTQNLQISPENSPLPPALQDWQQQFGNRNISQLFGAKSYLWSEGTTKRVPNYTPPPQPPSQKLPQLPTQGDRPTSSNITSTGSQALTKFSNTQPSAAKMQDLLPLRHLTTLEEISSFLRVIIPTPHPVPGMAIAQPTYPTMTAEEMFNKYHHLITPDTYIVGLGNNGNVITSSWEEIPHRLIAGQPGFGKTNFIQWIVFQFLYKNPEAKIYVMDFKAVDFPDLKSFLPNFSLEVVTEVEEALTMIEAIDLEEENRIKLIQENKGARRLADLQSKGIPIYRLLWIIDEAADIADASYDLAENIEKRLKKYARKGRSFGINMIYAAQTPDSSVISKQVTEQLGEKTVFKVSYGASMNVLEIGDAENINKKGRAILHRSVNDWFYVNTPLMPDLSKQPFDKTIWAKLSQATL